MVVQVPREGATLIEKSLVPVIFKLKAWDPEMQTVLEFSRFARNEPLENLSLEALIQGFEKITGEAAKDVLTLAGKGDSLEVTRYLVSETIVYANSLANKGQRLTIPNKSTTAASGNATGSSVGDASTSADSAAQKEMIVMRQDLDAFKNKSKDMQVDEALQYVRTLASRPKLTSNPSVLLAAIEMLVDAANKADHKDSAMYQKSFSTCRKYEEHPDFCGLVLKLFGSQEDKRISSLVADLAKSKKYDEIEHTYSKSDKKGAPPPQEYCMGYPGFGFPTPGFGAPYPGFFPGHSGFRPPFRGGAGRGQRRSSGACLYCKEEGHFVSNCPKITKEN